MGIDPAFVKIDLDHEVETEEPRLSGVPEGREALR
jgi:hypothetical protein